TSRGRSPTTAVGAATGTVAPGEQAHPITTPTNPTTLASRTADIPRFTPFLELQMPARGERFQTRQAPWRPRYGEAVPPRMPAQDRAVRWLSVAATLGMLLVLVMGAAVTNTGSAEGCGRSWPLCNGQFVPEFTVATAIEYSHRAVSGIEGLLVVALSVVMLARWRREREIQVLVPLMLGSLLLQAGLGAAAVMMPQSPAVLASHFGVSLIAFAAT